MKKLNRLDLNSGKLMKNEELMKLRGGYEETGCAGVVCNQSYPGGCCKENPSCKVPIGYPDITVCFSN